MLALQPGTPGVPRLPLSLILGTLMELSEPRHLYLKE